MWNSEVAQIPLVSSLQVHSTKCCQANSMAEVPAGPGCSATGGKSVPPRLPQMTCVIDDILQYVGSRVMSFLGAKGQVWNAQIRHTKRLKARFGMPNLDTESTEREGELVRNWQEFKGNVCNNQESPSLCVWWLMVCIWIEMVFAQRCPCLTDRFRKKTRRCSFNSI